MAGRCFAQAHDNHAIRLVFRVAVGHEAFAFETPQAFIQVLALRRVAAMQVHTMPKAPGFFSEFAGEVQPRGGFCAGQDIKVDLGQLFI